MINFPKCVDFKHGIWYIIITENNKKGNKNNDKNDSI